MSRLSLILPLAALAAAASADITVDNFEAGEVVRYPVVMLRGHSGGEAVAVGRDLKNVIRFPVVNGEYRAIAELKPGTNMVVLRAGADTVRFRIDYKPPTTPLKVMAVWAKASDETVPADAKTKMDVAMKLLQCFYAEAMHDAGYGRKTFPLELDKKGEVPLHILSLPKTGDEMRAMENNASWGYLYDQLKQQFPEDQTHWCTMLGFSRFDRETRKTPGHYALGGGSLGAFGSASMVYWPASMKDVTKVFLDARNLDPNQDFDDSNSRRTVWANVSTGWGAMAHEMGHTFGLPHSNDRFSVMSRGFDFLSRTFTVGEAPRAGAEGTVTFKPDERSRWDLYSAARLNWNPYFQPDRGVTSALPEPKIEIRDDEIRLVAPAGIRVWGVDRDDVTAFFEQNLTDNLVTERKLSKNELREKMGGKLPYRITLIDSLGRQVTLEDKGESKPPWQM